MFEDITQVTYVLPDDFLGFCSSFFFFKRLFESSVEQKHLRTTHTRRPL